jgi:hypothetical protein
MKALSALQSIFIRLDIVITCQPEALNCRQRRRSSFQNRLPNFSEGEIGSFNAAKGGYPPAGGLAMPKQPCCRCRMPNAPPRREDIFSVQFGGDGANAGHALDA